MNTNKTIYFKNGTSTPITWDIAKLLFERIKKGCQSYQLFEDEKGNPLFVVNISEITHIQ